jgi:hypothetical protein
VTITGVPPTLPAPAPERPRRRFPWPLLFLLIWPGLPLLSMVQSTWQDLDIEQFGAHGLDLQARDRAGQHWTLGGGEPNGRNVMSASRYVITNLSPGDTVTTWTDIAQNGHFGIPTRIDGVADPIGPLDVVDATVTTGSEAHFFPPNGSPVGTVSQLPVGLKPGDMAELNLIWTITSCHAPGVDPQTFSVSSVDLHETVLGVHRTRGLPLGFTLALVEPACATG